MSENASLVHATSLMAGNGVVLLKVYDVLNDQITPPPHPFVILALLALPPILGLMAGLIMVSRLELRTYKPSVGTDQWLAGIGLFGIGLPLGTWLLNLAILFTHHH